MKWKLGVAFLVLLLPLAACQGREEPAQTENAPAAETAPVPPVGEAEESTSPGTGASPADAAAADAADPGSSTPAGTAPGAAAPGATAFASQETNWSGVIAEVTEFRRKGNTLTAKVRLRNQGSAEVQPEIIYKEAYLMDLGAGKKYEVLKDEKGTYIAALRQNWGDRWYEELQPGQAMTIWMKFPAPPADVKTVTLQIPGAPPFEDLPIQDV
ncbi:MAG TPA: hypothetical protein VF756_08810 [Thermoanaerobaculia bacterium]